MLSKKINIINVSICTIIMSWRGGPKVLFSSVTFIRILSYEVNKFKNVIININHYNI